jgi:hypothetical protein
MYPMLNVRALMILGLAISMAGCNAKTAATAASDSSSGGTFTAADLIGSGTTACTAGASGIPGSTYYKSSITFTAGSNFNYTQIWYSASDCAPAHYAAMWEVAGTYTVGGVISSSSSLQSIQYTVTSSYLAAYTAGNVTYFDSHCSNTGYVLGTLRSTYMATCSFATTPNAGNATVDNVIGMGGGHVYIGAPTEGIPGVFVGTAIPTTTSMTF